MRDDKFKNANLEHLAIPNQVIICYDENQVHKHIFYALDIVYPSSVIQICKIQSALTNDA